MDEASIPYHLTAMTPDAFNAIPFGIYLCFLLAPFVQEDAAVIGAATASASGLGEPAGLLAAILLGLTLSDLWKYWAGRAALTQDWAKRFAEKPGVTQAREGIVNRLGKTLMAVRFIPGTRIPAYVASGFFKAPFAAFSFYVVVSAFLYIALTFTLFHTLGEIAGEQAKAILPVVAIVVVAAVIGYTLLKPKFRSQ